MKEFAGTITDIRIRSFKLNADSLTKFSQKNPNALLDPGPKYFTGIVSDSPDQKFEGKKIKSAFIIAIDYLYGFVETYSGIYKVGDHPDLELIDGDILIVM